jgi:hypothetical protein
MKHFLMCLTAALFCCFSVMGQTGGGSLKVTSYPSAPMSKLTATTRQDDVQCLLAFQSESMQSWYQCLVRVGNPDARTVTIVSGNIRSQRYAAARFGYRTSEGRRDHQAQPDRKATLARRWTTGSYRAPRCQR